MIGAAEAEYACLKIERWPADFLEHERLLAKLVSELEPKKYAHALARGAELSLEEAIDFFQQ